jgi:PQQ-like domain/PQQ enzyme repeat
MTKELSKDITKAFTKRIKTKLSNRSVRAVALSLLFIVSGIGASVLINPAAATPNTAAPSAVAAAPAAAPAATQPALTQAEANWEFPNGNAFDQDYNPQNQINSSNVQDLGLSWIYPMPSVPTSLASLGAGLSDVSAGMAVLVVNGTAFVITDFDETIAFNVANGDVLWTDQTPLAPNQTAGEATGPVPLHDHDGNEWFSTATFLSGVSGPTLWYQGENNRVYAIDALNGKYELNFSDFTGLNMVAGNNPQSIYNGIGASNIVINPQLGILVSGHDAESDADNGRGFFAGWNLNTNPVTMKWITYDVPPQPGSPTAALNPYFDQQLIANMTGAASSFYPGQNGSTNGYTTSWEVAGGVLHNVNNDIVVNWKSLSATQLNATLYNDWGQSDQSSQCLAIDGGGSTGSTGSAWGGAWLVGSGQSAGMVILGTNNKDPYVGPCTPGPDLWSASSMALNMTTGQIIWAFQANAHDLWDYDCSWYQALGNVTISGVNTEVVIKTCKNGYMYEINAVTGNLIWAWSPPSGGDITPGPARCPVCYMWNPLNSTQMHFDYPSAMTNCAPAYTSACILGQNPPYYSWPSASAGFESEQAFDPANGQIYATSHLTPAFVGYLGLNASTYFTSPGMNFGQPCPTCGTIADNATTWDIDAATGNIMWHYATSTYEGYRGQTDVSGNVVYTMQLSGDLIMLDATTGHLLRDYYIGAPLDISITIGAAVDGQEYLLFPVGGCALAAVSTCPGSTPGDIIALTLVAPPSSSASTSTTTVVSTSVSTTTTTAVLSASTTTSVTTVTSTATSSSNNTALYGVAIVAVIFIIATGYLAMRGRKPGS